jgi:hypothetical protein
VGITVSFDNDNPTIILTSQTSVGLKVNLTDMGTGQSVYASGNVNYLQFAPGITTTIAPFVGPNLVDVAQQRLFFNGVALGDQNIQLGTVTYGLNNNYNNAALGAAPFDWNSANVNVGAILSKAGATLTATGGTYDAFANFGAGGGMTMQAGACAVGGLPLPAWQTATFSGGNTIATWGASSNLRDLIAGGANICGTVTAANTVPIDAPVSNEIELAPQSNAGFNETSTSQTGALADIDTNGDNAMIMFANNPNAAPGFYPRVTNAGAQDCTVYVDVWSEDGTPAPNFSFDLYTVSGASTSPSFNASGQLNAQASFMFTAQALMDAAGITSASRMRVRVYGDTTNIDIQGYTTPGSNGELFIQSW